MWESREKTGGTIQTATAQASIQFQVTVTPKGSGSGESQRTPARRSMVQDDRLARRCGRRVLRRVHVLDGHRKEERWHRGAEVADAFRRTRNVRRPVPS